MKVHGGMEDIQQRATHQIVVLAAADQVTHDVMDFLGIAVSKLCGVAFNPNAALLAHGVNRADLNECFTAATEQDAEVLTVASLAHIGTLARSGFDQLVDAAAQLLEHGILIKAVIRPSQDKGQTIYHWRLGSRLRDNGTDFHISAFKT